MRLLSISSLILLLSLCDGYRILGIFPFFAKSHFMMFEQLMKGLARNGHQVDVIGSFPLKTRHPNYTDLVSLKQPRDFVNNFTYAEMKMLVASSPVHAVATLGGSELCELLGHPEILNIIKNPPQNPPYDAVLIEIFGAPCFAAIGHLWKVPVIGASSSALYPWCNHIIGNPENLAYMPNNLLPYGNDMTFWQRMWNLIDTYYNKFYFDYLTNEQDDIVRRHLGQDIPSVRELEKTVSLVLVNSHTSMTGMRPIMPALVEVGGLHVQDEGPDLPKNLEKWMNDSTEGFVYFTFGSMVKIESFPPKYLDVFYKSLGKIAPVRVLMKIPNPEDLPPGLPNNILTFPWIPQIKVLKHPNVKAFITHGGLMGTQEAIHHGIPLIGIPLFADQFINIDIYVRKNFAVKLDIDNLTEEKMDQALNSVLRDPVYRKTAKKMSKSFLDRPLNAVETANYWVEYVIRNGKDVLRSPAMDLTWWQLHLLDVYAFLLLIVLITLAVLLAIGKFALNLFFPIPDHGVSRSKKIS